MANTVMDAMVNAAKAAVAAAGGDWNAVKDNIIAFSQSLAGRGAEIAGKYAQNKLTRDEASDLLKMLGNLADEELNYTEEAALKALQDGVNAAIDALLAAAKAALEVG